jgi:sortase B
MRDRKNRRVARTTRLRLKRRKQKRYGRVQVGLGIVFFLCIGILLLLFIRQCCDDAVQRQVMQEMMAAKEEAKTEINANQSQNSADASTYKLTLPCAGVELALQEIFNEAYEMQMIAQTEPVMLPEYAALYEQNSDMIGWLRIEDTVIDYPVMQTMEDEDYYLDYDFNGDANSNGSLILDTDSTAGVGTARCQYINGTSPSTNLIIHGHTMRSGMMFGGLKQYAEKSYGEKHSMICFDSLYEKREYELISVFYSQVYMNTDDVFKYYNFFQADTQEEFDNWYENIKAMSLYDTGVTAEYGDEFITLSCCSYQVEDGRFVVVGKRIK